MTLLAASIREETLLGLKNAMIDLAGVWVETHFIEPSLREEEWLTVDPTEPKIIAALKALVLLISNNENLLLEDIHQWVDELLMDARVHVTLKPESAGGIILMLSGRNICIPKKQLEACKIMPALQSAIRSFLQFIDTPEKQSEWDGMPRLYNQMDISSHFDGWTRFLG